MPIYKPSELRLFLNQLGIFPKKGLSQNFLIDGNIIRKIVRASDVQPGNLVLEIGPGPGSLTQAMLEVEAHVVAVEKDFVLARELKRFQTPSKQLEIFCEDILMFSVEEELQSRLRDDQKAKVIANLPYHLTTPILAEMVVRRKLFSSLTVMVQEEVARRMTALPGQSDYSSFTIFLNFYSKPRYGFTVSRNCFYPAPKVDSAIVVLELKEPPPNIDAQVFFKITRTAFEQRRKMLRASLKSLFDPSKISNALEIIGQNPQARPEVLSLEDFIKLYHELYSSERH
ncbi:16S rRNA (adenine(1518)-N(6)/adenine(1519)-N(6))-dimethyltransferase RsmA [Candidatus Protochlamydia amoebophila]|uniref:Ribosomal RNA small subunit methyltransferase A n=2 Tax=Protochlamydia amoebophila (strain UWE25) TaxID=264201 RepID=RSMA_PARUW|nr:16S rRNA (adenine(1518)-N(6)/adenine(1519)-N(6))-dimethyltransferase RsmA [Candidatus Protochlamydia amoebophila]Q6ME80.2 RecName: Full=Ribosomal RNA small subunit methyltransferase A; AltName: Full=16S rRNA (adenine(1518)-N(6)/adenine(1519)-N(6))-dimethyltransferase; AltName: Full=16S rRNA dimethyladenosine transferase; AltName: Full=16S rRNA dimethylase; AltName: Full=S-adenosylmethionine-6-N', N'-adenosyl(rRNA) dimethyltransferase [Candidatus Protochlamydia amoebophila UWE25]SPJ31624.1 unna